MLSINDVTYEYGKRRALDDVNLVVDGGVTALVGVNGAGKSTLLSIAAGGLRPPAGVVTIDGIDVYGKQRRTALPRIAWMPQAVTFPARMTALEVVEYLTWMRGFSRRGARERAVSALERVNLGSRSNDSIRSLSGGMVRRVCLAQALAVDPDILLLDEPSTGLDPEQRRLMVDSLADLPGAVLLSSHVMEDVADLASKVVVLDEGRVLFDGDLCDFTARVEHPDAARAAEVAFLSIVSESRRGI